MSGVRYLQQFDRRQLFRFFVDGRFHQKYRGWVGYEENESGSTQAMLRGFEYMLDNFDLTGGVTLVHLMGLHRACMFNVITKNPKTQAGEIRFLNAGFVLSKSVTTRASLEDLFRIRGNDNSPMFNTSEFARSASELDIDTLLSAIEGGKRVNYRPWYPKDKPDLTQALAKETNAKAFYYAKHFVQLKLIARLEEVISTFNRDIKLAKEDDEKLLLFSDFARKMDLLHPLADGNCRAIACLLLNHLLMFHGFPPAILYNPNLDVELTAAQFVDEIKTGIENTMKLITDPRAELYGFSVDELNQESTLEFADFSKDFGSKLDNYAEIYATSEHLTEWTGGTWHNKDLPVHFTGAGSHTTVRQGNLYFAVISEWIKGKKDVAAELKRAEDRGARAIILDREEYITNCTVPVLQVDNVDDQMRTIAVQSRQGVDCKAVLLTGTVGKTGGKFILHHILTDQVPAHATLNSTNTRVPTLRSLLNLRPQDKAEIIEVAVGASPSAGVYRGTAVNPDICLFTDIAPNHMNIHGSVETLIAAKSAVVEGLRQGGLCIINRDAELYAGLREAILERRPDALILTFGRHEEAYARLISASYDPANFRWDVQARIAGENYHYTVPLFQEHAPAQSVGLLLTVREMGFNMPQAMASYAKPLDTFESMGRIFKVASSTRSFIFYDQSPRGAIQGFRSAFADLKRFNFTGRKVFLLGGSSTKVDDEFTKTQHNEIAELVNASGVDRLYTTGNFAYHIHDGLSDASVFVKHSDDLDELEKWLDDELQDGDFLFIMGDASLYLGRLGKKMLKKGTCSRLA